MPLRPHHVPITPPSRPVTTCHVPSRPCYNPVTSRYDPITSLSRPVTTLSRPHSPGSKVIVRSRGRIQLILKTPRNGLHLNSLRALRSTFSLFFLGTKRGRFVTAFTQKFTDIGRNWSLNIITNIESQQTWKRYRPNRSISQRFYSRGWSHGKRCLLNKSCVPPILVFLQNPRWHPHDV